MNANEFAPTSSMINELILAAAERLFQRHCTQHLIGEAEDGTCPAPFLEELYESGLLLSLVPEDLGGAGGSCGLGAQLAKLGGRYAVPVPFVESLLANWLLASSGLSPVTSGVTTFALLEPNDLLQGRPESLIDVPFGRNVSSVVAVHAEKQGLVTSLFEINGVAIQLGYSLAGEARDTLHPRSDAVSQKGHLPTGMTMHNLKAFAALLRAAQIVGALEAVLSLSLNYVQQRHQFGRPISKFQLVQAMIVEIASETELAGAALDGAVSDLGRLGLGADSMIAIATAKITAGTAAEVVAKSAHQVHGAMGFSLEYPLQRYTRRLWSWREEYGSETEWARWLGFKVAEKSNDSLWASVTGT